MSKVPLYVRVLSKLIPIIESDKTNIAKGEITKFNFTEIDKNKLGFNKQMIGSKGGYDFIWRHISNDYFKVIGKWPE